MTSRRSLITRAFSLGSAALASTPADAQSAKTVRSGFLDLQRTPDFASVHTLDSSITLTRSGSRWTADGISVQTEPSATGLLINVSAPKLEPVRLHLRWRTAISGTPLVLGDAWERSYGELSWRSIVSERVMPWYFLTQENGVLHGYGVKTGAGALCFWQLDSQGVSLWLDCSNGGDGVRLGDRELHAATVVTRKGVRGENLTSSAAAFCRVMCEHPRLSASPLYGANDWYYAYGKNSAEQTLRDADLVASLSTSNRVRPFAVIDMGWADGSKTFPSMPQLARDIKSRQVRPGLWIRPLEAPHDTSKHLLLPAARFGKLSERAKELAYDPTIPEAVEVITDKVAQPVSWGYELIKHDFSTYDLLGKWGREMGPEPTSAGWHLHDRTRTNAEVIRDLYKAIRERAGANTLLIGCNTVGHLGAGIFEAQRTGDDTSGKEWERTRRMGVNTLAYRLPQHNTFFAVDPDCVGITPQIPWELNRQWLDLIARSGVAVFISPDPRAIGNEQRSALKEAFATAAAGQSHAAPQNWLRDSTPDTWVVTSRANPSSPAKASYDWTGPAGCPPFDI